MLSYISHLELVRQMPLMQSTKLMKLLISKWDPSLLVPWKLPNVTVYVQYYLHIPRSRISWLWGVFVKDIMYSGTNMWMQVLSLQNGKIKWQTYLTLAFCTHSYSPANFPKNQVQVAPQKRAPLRQNKVNYEGFNQFVRHCTYVSVHEKASFLDSNDGALRKFLIKLIF